MDKFIRPTESELTLSEWLNLLEQQNKDNEEEPIIYNPPNDFCFYL